MPTPSQSPGSDGSVTQNKLATLEAVAGAFHEAVGALQQIYNEVTDASMSLGNAMISPSSTIFQNNAAQWIEDFNSLKGGLQNIAEGLDNQVATTQKNEGLSAEIAAGSGSSS